MAKESRSRESEGEVAPAEEQPQLAAGSGAKRRPRDWSSECGVPEWAHVAARRLHGWHEHRYHAGSSMLVTKNDYLAAVAAANANTGAVAAHGPALSEHKGKGI